MIAFVDTMVLVWFVRKEAPEGQEEMIERTQWLMETFDHNGDDVMVSEVSVAEFLRGSSPSQRAAQGAIIEETFIRKAFGTPEAQVAADLFDFALTIQDLWERKSAMKADVQIVATAIASGADILYSHDLGCRRLAESRGMEARDLPNIAPSLFHDQTGTQ